MKIRDILAQGRPTPVSYTHLLRSEVYSHYIRYFQGKKMIIIHRAPRPLDEKADMVVYDLPQNILPLLVEEE